MKHTTSSTRVKRKSHHFWRKHRKRTAKRFRCTDCNQTLYLYKPPSAYRQPKLCPRCLSRFIVPASIGAKQITPFADYRIRDALLRKMGFASYAAYLQSDLWQQLRRRVLHRDKNQCRSCGEPATEIHHVAYTKGALKGLNIAYLVSLCRECHIAAEFFEDGRKTTQNEAGARLYCHRGKCRQCHRRTIRNKKMLCRACCGRGKRKKNRHLGDSMQQQPTAAELRELRKLAETLIRERRREEERRLAIENAKAEAKRLG